MQMDNFQNLSKEELIKLLHQSIAERNKAKVELDKAKAELAKKMQTLSDIQDIFDKSNEEITHEVDVMNTLIDNYFEHRNSKFYVARPRQ